MGGEKIGRRGLELCLVIVRCVIFHGFFDPNKMRQDTINEDEAKSEPSRRKEGDWGGGSVLSSRSSSSLNSKSLLPPLPTPSSVARPDNFRSVRPLVSSPTRPSSPTGNHPKACSIRVG